MYLFLRDVSVAAGGHVGLTQVALFYLHPAKGRK